MNVFRKLQLNYKEGPQKKKVVASARKNKIFILFSAEGRRGMSFVEIADSWHYEPFAENLTNINVISSS